MFTNKKQWKQFIDILKSEPSTCIFFDEPTKAWRAKSVMQIKPEDLYQIRLDQGRRYNKPSLIDKLLNKQDFRFHCAAGGYSTTRTEQEALKFFFDAEADWLSKNEFSFAL